MPLISAAPHGIIDYLSGVVLLALPLVLGLSGAAPLALQLVGAATILISLVTAYPPSVAKLVPYRVHLMLDVGMGLVMLIAAWLTWVEGLGSALLLAAGLIYLVVPALSWPRR